MDRSRLLDPPAPHEQPAGDGSQSAQRTGPRKDDFLVHSVWPLPPSLPVTLEKLWCGAIAP